MIISTKYNECIICQLSYNCSESSFKIYHTDTTIMEHISFCIKYAT